MRRRFLKAATSLVLAALMVIQPMGGTIEALAAELSTDVAEQSEEVSEEIVSEEESAYEGDAVSEDATSEAVSEDATSEAVSEDATSEAVSEDATSEAVSEDENSEEATEIIIEEVTEEDSETAEDITDIPNFSMPEDYTLTSDQQDNKEALQGELCNISAADEGITYVEKEAVFLADTLEDAQEVAKAYNATVKSYEYGVAVIGFAEVGDVVKALAAGALDSNNLPAIWPNYYCYKTEDVTPQADDSVSIVEEEISEETSEETIMVGDEEVSQNDYDVTMQAYTDPYLKGSNEYYQWHHQVVGSTYAWQAGYKGAGVTVAVLDTGLKGSTDVTASKNFNMFSTGNASDADGHGTHVAGVIGAKLNNNVLGAGVAPEATLINIKVLNDEGMGSTDIAMKGIQKAIAEGADIINMSLGGPGYSADYQLCINEAREAGVTVIAAAGNEGNNNKFYPAAYKGVFTVAATDKNNKKVFFSNYGSYVDVAAPGHEIISVAPDGGVAIMSGTSQACPVVAGEAAVILAAFPEIMNEDDGLKRVNALESKLKSGTFSAGSGCGKGIVSLPKVLKLATSTAKPTAPAVTAVVNAAKTGVTVTMLSKEAVSIYYTTDGKTPVYKNGTLVYGSKYMNPFTLSSNSKYTIKAIAVNASGVSSAVKSVSVTLKPVVTSISITGANTFAKGKGTQLKATVAPSYAANKKIKWDVSAAAKAAGITINQSGKITSKKTTATGTYTATATSTDGSDISSKQFSFSVIDAVKVKTAKFKKGSYSIMRTTGTPTLSLGSELTGTLLDGKTATVAGNFYWDSSNADIASVTSAGIVSAKKSGTVTITALANDGSGKKASCKVTVVQNATGIKIGNYASNSTIKVAAGKSIKLPATISPADTKDKKVLWSIKEADQGKGVTVSNGTIKTTKNAIGNTVTVYATANSNNSISAIINISVIGGSITKIIADSTVKLFRTAGNYNAITGYTADITVVVSEGGDANALKFTNNNPGLFTITSQSNTGVRVNATGLATGTGTVTVESTDGSNKKATIKVVVSNPVSSILVAPQSGRYYYLGQGKSLQFSAELGTEYGAIANKKVNWSITSAEGLKISAGGKVTATKKTPIGYYIVTATAADGSNASTTYSVRVDYPITKLSVPDLDPGPFYAGIYFPSGVYLGKSGYVIIDYNTAYQQMFIASSSNSDVIAVSTKNTDDGVSYLVLSFLKKGTTVITVSSTDGSGKKVSYNVEVR